MRKPTAEELSRDLSADWEVIRKATSGKWIACSGNEILAENGTSIATEILGHRRTSFDGDGEGYVVKDADADFIAASRQGWEAAVALASHYKAECERLKREIADWERVHRERNFFD